MIIFTQRKFSPDNVHVIYRQMSLPQIIQCSFVGVAAENLDVVNGIYLEPWAEDQDSCECLFRTIPLPPPSKKIIFPHLNIIGGKMF